VPTRRTQVEGRIEITGLGFRYADTQPWLYRGLNLIIPPGKTVALMGPSGCGKSTLSKLLLGFLMPAEGIIKIDGVDTRFLSANELRNAFGVVPQETILFSGTVYDNLIAAAPHASFEDVETACRMAEIHDHIQGLSQGYQTEIGEKGAGLSGGQKQRIAIARALLKRPKILIFDEATSNLDPITAEAFAKTINQLKGQATMIFITHQLPKALQVDGLVQLGGQVAEAVPRDQKQRA
jgi:subfamily B ATP-binding cassette protein HlyB/CyaB